MSSESNNEVRSAAIYQRKLFAGYLREVPERKGWVFTYAEGYSSNPVSLTMPVRSAPYDFDSFPAFFEGLLPEGSQLEALLRTHKIDRNDCFRQLVTVGGDLIGSLSVVDATASALLNPPSLT
jgi:serine/threonine-protein kinase HipA